jgi:Gas vesicle protein K.
VSEHSDAVTELARESAAAFAEELRHVAQALPERINADPEQVENGLARLVLTLIELLRNVLEHQAVRRMEGGTLSEDEVERLGLALLKLNERMQELKATFNLTDEDLNIDLGPLGRLR